MIETRKPILTPSGLWKCQACGAVQDHPVAILEAGPHFARMDCGKCGRFVRFLPKPDTDKAKRPAAHKRLVGKSGLDYCELCLILEERLPAHESLEAHHIEEYADGGDCANGNTLICCTSCHRFIHWRRTEIQHHVTKEGQHHVGREQVSSATIGPAAVGELEDSSPWRETDEGADATERAAGQ